MTSTPKPHRGKTEAPRISVVIPTFNRWPMVADAVASALRQSLPPYEVIVVDDGSTDATTPRLQRAFPDIKVTTQANRERGAARNRGLAEAAGSHVVFLDADDLLSPGHFERFSFRWRSQRSPDLPFCSRALLWDPVDNRATPIGPRASHFRDPPAAALWGMVFPLPSLIVPTEAARSIGGFPEDRLAAGSEDWVFLVRLTRQVAVKAVDWVGCIIRQHSGRSMNDVESRVRSSLAAKYILIDEARRIGLSEDELRQTSANAHRTCAALLYGSGNIHDARSHLAMMRAYLTSAELRRMFRLTALTSLPTPVSRLLRRALSNFASVPFTMPNIASS